LPTPDTSPTSELSEREREILRMVATGASNKEIAQRLYISPNTVKVHLRNIFAKIGVTSRTEATLHALQQGYVRLPAPGLEPATRRNAAEATALDKSQTGVAPARGVVGLRQVRVMMVSLVVITAILVLVVSLTWRPVTAPGRQVTPAPLPTFNRWEQHASLSTARSSMAAAVYDNRIYVIGGDSAAGVIGLTERYDQITDQWETLNPKPLPVADSSAAVISGLIYVPGGRTSDGTSTNVLAVYDPVKDEWAERASLPNRLSAYALAAFEGKLYLFGGWDGHRYVNTTYSYDPEQDVWKALPSMPTARGFAGAAVVGGKIYVVGGTNEHGPLTTHESFLPPGISAVTPPLPWNVLHPLTVGRSAAGIASVADIIYVFGGEKEDRETLDISGYVVERDEWVDTTEGVQPRSFVSVVGSGSSLYLIGGKGKGSFLKDNLSYQVVFMAIFPVIVK